MAKNENLHRAKEKANDEFYTQLCDIENELKHYRHHFKNKIILCNCDDPYESNFFKYFAMNFNYLGLKKLIATCYDGSPVANTELDLFTYLDFIDTPSKNAYKVEITHIEDLNNDGAIDLTDVELMLKKKGVVQKLKGNGDFRSEECIELLKQADIVVTNPPFSLFREYVAQLMEYNKKFVVLANMNCITYKEFFSLLKNNKVWSGYGFNQSFVFKSPYKNSLEANRKFVKSKGYNPDDNYIKVPAICWFTNIDIDKRHEDIILYKKYTPEEYPKYDNYDAIEVSKVVNIPMNYDGAMGVPITFLDKYNPEQFEIIGLGISTSGIEIGIRGYLPEHKKYRKEIQKRGAVDGDLYMLDELGHPVVPYARILIRKKS